MDIINNPSRSQWPELITRNIPDDDASVTEAVEQIVADVAARGDEALFDYALRFDKAALSSLRLTEDEINQGADAVSSEIKAAIDRAARNIEAFHAAQLPSPITLEVQPGIICEQHPVAIDRVGLYIPGGRAPLFSTVLMLGLPARIAGCREIILCTPRSGQNPVKPEILYAARVCGIKNIYCIGGAQAIAAMAYGTDSIPRVDKIFGPGNRFVTKAKQLVSQVVAIDMPAGPSEVMVMADESANPSFVAADLLSQAEHGPDSQAVAVCSSSQLAARIASEVERQAALLSRADSVAGSLSKSRLIILPERRDAIDFANAYGAEHLIISMLQPREIAAEIRAAGSIFIGNYSPESAGDYASGTNHTLPTAGWASSLSGVNIDSFIHKITWQELTHDGLKNLAPTITAMAVAEGLDAHAAAVTVRTAR